MHKKLYLKQANPVWFCAGGLAGMTGLMIFFVPPASVIIEIITIGFLLGTIVCFLKGIKAGKKWKYLIPIGVWGFLMMGRWGILDFLMAGLWITVLVLISLSN